MKYYKIKIQRIYKGDLLAGRVNGEKIKDGQLYFERLSAGEIIKNAPIFDYFFLESYDSPQYWEWSIFDIHGFWLNTDIVGAWLISSDLKLLLENFNLPDPHHFYPSKLKYKNEKHNYFIYQFAGDMIIRNVLNKYVIWKTADFINEKTNSIVNVSSREELISVSEQIYDSFGCDPILKKIAINKDLDFLPLARYFNCDIASERLKKAIEEMGITGFEFSELDFEVVIEK